MSLIVLSEFLSRNQFLSDVPRGGIMREELKFSFGTMLRRDCGTHANNCSYNGSVQLRRNGLNNEFHISSEENFDDGPTWTFALSDCSRGGATVLRIPND